MHRRVSAPRTAVGRAFRPAPGVEAVPAGGSGLVLRTPHDRCVSLRGMGARAWTLLDRGASLRTMRLLLRREYGIPLALADTELGELLGRLERGGFIERTG
jgi:hypothetical protein